MTREEIIRFLNQNPVCHLATLEEGAAPGAQFVHVSGG